MPPVAIEPTISTGEWRQTYALDPRPPGPKIRAVQKPKHVAQLVTSGVNLTSCVHFDQVYSW
jgi:hypothetical protein